MRGNIDLKDYTKSGSGLWICPYYGVFLTIFLAIISASEIWSEYLWEHHTYATVDILLKPFFRFVCVVILLRVIYEVIRLLFHLYAGNGKFGGFRFSLGEPMDL